MSFHTLCANYTPQYAAPRIIAGCALTGAVLFPALEVYAGTSSDKTFAPKLLFYAEESVKGAVSVAVVGLGVCMVYTMAYATGFVAYHAYNHATSCWKKHRPFRGSAEKTNNPT
jgi:hypothetical protein